MALLEQRYESYKIKINCFSMAHDADHPNQNPYPKRKLIGTDYFKITYLFFCITAEIFTVSITTQC